MHLQGFHSSRRFALPASAFAGAFLASTLLLAPLGLTPQSRAAEASKTAAEAGDEAWKSVEKALRPPNFPEAWQKERPTREEYAKLVVPHVIAASTQAATFAAKYPKHPKAEEARKQQSEMLNIAASLGSKEAGDMLAKIEVETLKDKSLSEDDRFQLRARQVQRAAMSKQSEGQSTVFAELGAGARQLLKEFPKRTEPFEMLLEAASNSEGEQGAALLKELLASEAPDEIKDQAKALAKKLDIVGKPLPVQFKAVDGREVNLEKMKGKVVLVDFWATWCGPCVAELPNVLAAYKKLNSQGFEIVGISFDQKKDDLTEFVKEHNMPWAQYFDGKGWKNEIGRTYAINSIPSMWLIDKKGNVRDLNARDGLVGKVERLLAEP